VNLLKGIKMTDLINGIGQWRNISECLNGIIASTGKEIDINNRTIWQEYLHKWTNKDWEDMIGAVLSVKQEDPTLFKAYHDSAIAEAKTALLKGDPSKRIMDTKLNKRIAWRSIMTLREVWNQMNDTAEAKPNTPKTTAKRPKVTLEETEDYTRITVWHDLFEGQQ
jgi:hypothetical protein